MILPALFSEWPKKMKVERASIDLQQEEMRITKTQVETKCRKISNWKAPGPNGVQGYWLKKITSCHERIAEQLDAMVCGKQEIPLWMTYGRTVLCLKDPEKGSSADNFRPISCLPLMWKLLTGVIAEHVYAYLETSDLPQEQIGCRKKCRGTKDQLLIDQRMP